MVATISEKQSTGIQIRDYTFDQVYQLENIFGDKDELEY